VSVSYSSLAGAIALAVPALREGLTQTIGRASLLDWTSIAYLAVCGTVLGFVWFYQGVERIGTTRAGLFINFVPISAVILAFLMLQEPITWSLAVGALLVLSGVYLANQASPRQPPQPAARSPV
jgi:drug/metabolite transporter (DMT)-like permease